MRRIMTIGLAAGLLLATTVGTATAQDEDLRMGDDPAYFEQVEVPEAGVAVSFPPDWDVEIEMDYGEIAADDPETGYWNVLYASDEGGAWCDVTWYLAADGSLAGLAALTADNFAEEIGGEATAQATPVELSIGEAYRVDVQDPAQPSHTSIYIFDGEIGRYTMNCKSDERDARDWMDIAETLGWLSDGADPKPVLLIKGYDLDFVTLDEGILGMLMPSDWDIDVEMEEKEFSLSPDYEDAAPVFYTSVLYAESELGDWCNVKVHQDNPMSLEEHAAWDEANYAAGVSGDMVVEGSSAVIGSELGYQIDISSVIGLNAVRSYLFESGATRYEVTCASSLGPNSAWPAIAGSILPLDGEPMVEPEPIATVQPSGDVQRLQLDDAGVALSVPSAWTVIPQMEALSTALPPPYSELGEVTVWRMLESYDQADAWCNVYRYDDMPMSLDEHAAWFESQVSANADSPATVEVAPVSLPVGESIRLLETYAAGEVQVLYLFDLGGVREYLVCGASTLPADAWLSVAETIEPFEPAPVDDDPPDLPDGAVAWSVVQQFGTQLPVADPAGKAWLMSAWCDQAYWFEFADGTFEERLECRLTNDPVEPLEQQGRWPGETVTMSGGACEWTSKFWMVQDGSDVWASSWSVTVEPDGQVSGRSVYPAQELDCQSA